MYYTVYKVTNLINGKIYIGAHKTTDLNDRYMGSGTHIKHSVNKHGVENFRKEILFVFDTPEEMYAKEAEIVDHEFVAEERTYNLKVGGIGGGDYVRTASEKQRKSDATRRYYARCKQDPGWVEQDRKMREDSVKLRKQRSLQKYGDPTQSHKTFAGKKHSKETIEKMRISSRGKTAGNKNSQFGTCWMFDPSTSESKKIQKDDMQAYLDNGWIAGRKLKT